MSCSSNDEQTRFLLNGVSLEIRRLYIKLWKITFNKNPTSSELLQVIQNPSALKNELVKKRQLNTRKQNSSVEITEFEDVPNCDFDGYDEFCEKLAELGPVQETKYWFQRFRLFSRYSSGIFMNKEGWYSVTPEKIAQHIARRIWQSIGGPGIIVDGFCGPGGNAIQFALEAPPSSIVFTCDINMKQLLMAKQNARVYNVHNNIEFICIDFVRLAPRWRKNFTPDALFLSPPWGGPNYSSVNTFDLDMIKFEMGKDEIVDGNELLTVCCNSICPNIAYFLPKNVNQFQLTMLLKIIKEKYDIECGPLEIEGNYLEGKLKTITAYYGSLVNINDIYNLHLVNSDEDIIYHDSYS